MMSHFFHNLFSSKPALFFSLLFVSVLQAEAGSTVIPQSVFEQAGLNKLSAEELAALEEWVRGESTVADAAEKEPVDTLVLPTGDDRFGFEQVADRVAQILQSPDERIETRIDGRLRGWSGSTIFHLQNGQRWQQIDGSRMRYNLDNAEVILFRASMGTYFLKPKSLNSRVRVRRIE
jgi:hypothetical protein